MIEIGNRFIYIKNGPKKNDKRSFLVVNKKSDMEIASIEWYPYWSKWVMAPAANTLYDAECLESIFKFVGRIPRFLQSA